jgi:hypothetical protein
VVGDELPLVAPGGAGAVHAAEAVVARVAAATAVVGIVDEVDLAAVDADAVAIVPPLLTLIAARAREAAGPGIRGRESGVAARAAVQRVEIDARARASALDERRLARDDALPVLADLARAAGLLA